MDAEGYRHSQKRVSNQQIYEVEYETQKCAEKKYPERCEKDVDKDKHFIICWLEGQSE